MICVTTVEIVETQDFKYNVKAGDRFWGCRGEHIWTAAFNVSSDDPGVRVRTTENYNKYLPIAEVVANRIPEKKFRYNVKIGDRVNHGYGFSDHVVLNNVSTDDPYTRVNYVDGKFDYIQTAIKNRIS